MLPLQVVAIVGPTASGKTALSLAVAKHFDAEIVNLDAYQIYRGMDIGTAKASKSELAEVKHHLIDTVNIQHDASVAEFQTDVAAAISDINSRGRIAVCVGGSGMYVRAALDSLDIPATDAQVRAKYEARLTEVGAAALHAELAALDPAAAALILPGNARRIVRALEVIELTGANFKAALPDPQPKYRDFRVGLSVPRVELAERIERRVRAMLSAGWSAEVERLLADGLLETRTAVKAIGYREMALHIQGQLTEAEVITQVSAATLRFSKRQMQWFRRDARLNWFEYNDSELVEKVTAAIAAAIS